MGELCDAICSGNRSAAAAAWGINRAVFEPSRPIGRRVVMKVLEATGHLGVMKAGVQSGEPLRNVGKTSPIARKFTQLAVEASTPEWRQAFATASGLAESGIRPESYGRDKVGTPASGGRSSTTGYRGIWSSPRGAKQQHRDCRSRRRSQRAFRCGAKTRLLGSPGPIGGCARASTRSREPRETSKRTHQRPFSLASRPPILILGVYF